MELRIGISTKSSRSLSDLVRGLPLAHHGRSCLCVCLFDGRSCTLACLRPQICWAAPSVSVYRHSRMLALGLRLDLPVSGGIIEDDRRWSLRMGREIMLFIGKPKGRSRMISIARGLEVSVFRHLVAVTVHVKFVYRWRHTLYSCAPLLLYYVRRSPRLAGSNSAWVIFSQMLEVVYCWRSLYTWHTVEKLGLIALLCQASHFPVFDWLLTSLTYLTQSANILSVATLVYLPFQCGAAAWFFSPGCIARAFGLLTLDGNGCCDGCNHCMSLLVPLEGVLVGPVSAATALDWPTHCHVQAWPHSPRATPNTLAQTPH